MSWFALLACGTELGDSAIPSDTAGEPDSGLAPDENGDFLYDDSSILEFSLVLDDSALASLASDPRADVHADFSFLGTTYDVGLQLKGSESGSFRTMDEKAAFKVDFHQWDPEQRFFGIKRLTLNNMIQDNTMSHEHVAYRLFRDLGVPAPRHGYAKVTVNGEWFGLYGVVETPDEQFLGRVFPDDAEGNLYEGGYGGDFGEGQAALFDVKETEGLEADIADLEALAMVVENAEPAQMLVLINTYFDAEALFSMWGGELVIADTDGYTSLANNFLVYHSPTTDLWTMIPWGPDQAFVGDQGVWIDFYGTLAQKCADSPNCTTEIAAGVQRAVTTLESETYTAWVETETTRIEADCRADPRSEWGDYGCRDALVALRDWVRARPSLIHADLAE